MRIDLEDAGDIGYRSELALRLATLVQLWGSSPFRSLLVGSTHLDLSEMDARVLWELGFRGATRPGLLAREIGVTPATITKSATRLRARDAIENVVDGDDGRATLLRLTPTGLDVARRLYAIGDDMVARIVAEWDPDDVAALTRLARRLTRDAATFVDTLEREAQA